MSTEWLRASLATLPGPDMVAGDAVRARAADILRPSGALARLDNVAAWVAEWQGTAVPAVHRPAALIFAADHGVAAAGVSAYPIEVTGAMLAAFHAHRSTITAYADVVGATVQAIDVGVGRPTADFRTQAALTTERFGECVAIGRAAVESLDADLLVLGEMGIGNTTAAAAVTTV
ncbi:MAG: nicotinate-nucleotide--dimethylbenzimidazole phosphoribosyltransferase, partial [Actinomycetota bacterium]